VLRAGAPRRARRSADRAAEFLIGVQGMRGAWMPKPVARRWLLMALVFMDPAQAAAQAPPSVKEVMRRVAAYVDAYGERAAVVVATEQYTQQAHVAGPVPETRRILADFAIVKIDALRGWQGFRDVVEVDGARLPDRDDRLMRLLTAAGGQDEARRLSDESARFNIGRIARNFNVPTTALFFFTRQNQGRFKFSAKGVDSAGLWEIAYKETSRPTLIRTPAGDSLPCQGRLWVNPTDGTVMRTRLDVEGFGSGKRGEPRGIGRVDVTYQYVDALQMWLPASMDEDFALGPGLVVDSISGRALYTNYRQFTTSGRIK
jgi:hypothetical protein